MSTRTKKSASIVPSRTTSGTSITSNIDRIFEDFRRSIDSLLSPFYTSTFFAPSYWLTLPTSPLDIFTETLPIRYPVVDVVDEGDHYTVRAELPGFNKDNVDINVSEDTLQIKAEVKEEKETKDKRYLSKESAYSAFERAIQFPEPIVPSKVEGTMKDGVLTLTIPKKEPKSTKIVKVSLK